MWYFQERGTYVYLWLIHTDIWQKPMQYYKAIILQLKINNFFKKIVWYWRKETESMEWNRGQNQINKYTIMLAKKFIRVFCGILLKIQTKILANLI